MDIGSILADARKRAGLQQKDLAVILGISAGYLSDMEANRRSFPVSRVPDLPPAIRSAVASALVAEYHDKAMELSKWLAKTECAQLAEGGEI